MQHPLECMCETEIVHTFVGETAKHMHTHTSPCNINERCNESVFASCYSWSLFLPSKNITHIPHLVYKTIAHTRTTRATPPLACVYVCLCVCSYMCTSTTFMYTDFVLCQPFQFVESHDSPKMFTWDWDWD